MSGAFGLVHGKRKKRRPGVVAGTESATRFRIGDGLNLTGGVTMSAPSKTAILTGGVKTPRICGPGGTSSSAESIVS